MMTTRFLDFIVCLFVIFQKINADCLENLRVVETENKSATDLKLAWNFTCGQCDQCKIGQVNFVQFKVYWKHERWMACNTEEKVCF